MKTYDSLAFAGLLGFCGLIGTAGAPFWVAGAIIFVAGFVGGAILIGTGLALRWWLFGTYEPQWLFAGFETVGGQGEAAGIDATVSGIAQEAIGDDWAGDVAFPVVVALEATLDAFPSVCVVPSNVGYSSETLVTAPVGYRRDPVFCGVQETVQTAANAPETRYDVLCRGERGIWYLEGRQFSRTDADVLAADLLTYGWDVDVKASPRIQRAKRRLARGSR